MLPLAAVPLSVPVSWHQFLHHWQDPLRSTVTCHVFKLQRRIGDEFLLEASKSFWKLNSIFSQHYALRKKSPGSKPLYAFLERSPHCTIDKDHGPPKNTFWMDAIYLLEQGAKCWFSPAWAFVCPGSGNTSSKQRYLVSYCCMLCWYLPCMGRKYQRSPSFRSDKSKEMG